MTYANITGWGKCLPPAVLTNSDLATFLDTSDEWIFPRTGIRERRISHVGLGELASVAAKRALAAAGLEGHAIDLVILATCTPEDLIPNVASNVQSQIGATKAAAFDLNAACAGFLYALDTATALIQSGAYQKAMVVGADHLTSFMDWTNRDVGVLFADGAGAVVLEATDEVSGRLSSKLSCDATARSIIKIGDFGTSLPRFSTNGIFPIHFEGQEVFKHAVRGMTQACLTALELAGIEANDIDLVVPHQANRRIIETLAKKLRVPLSKVMINIEHYGNTSAASIPIALCDALEQARVHPGATLLGAAFGAGLTCAATVIRWGERTKPIATSSAELPPCHQTALELLAPAIEHCRTHH